MRWRSLSLAASALGAAALIAGSVFGAFAAVPASGATSNRAAVVVQFGDGRSERKCVSFNEPEVDGIQLLQRSGLAAKIERYASGAAVCKIGRDGCDYPGESCFCRYPIFWGYYTREGGNWAFSSVGATSRRIRDGDIDGWSWGANGAPPPPNASFSQVCTGSAAPPSSDPPPATSAPVRQPPGGGTSPARTSPPVAASRGGSSDRQPDAPGRPDGQQPPSVNGQSGPDESLQTAPDPAPETSSEEGPEVLAQERAEAAAQTRFPVWGLIGLILAFLATGLIAFFARRQ